MKVEYKVLSRVTSEDQLVQDIYYVNHGTQQLMHRHVLNTQDQQTREGLIALGWIPPLSTKGPYPDAEHIHFAYCEAPEAFQYTVLSRSKNYIIYQADALADALKYFHACREKWLRPATIMVSGAEVPAPETEPLEEGEEYFTPQPSGHEYFYRRHTWTNNSVAYTQLALGIVYRSKKDAIKRAKIMLGLDS